MCMRACCVCDGAEKSGRRSAKTLEFSRQETGSQLIQYLVCLCVISSESGNLEENTRRWSSL